MTKEQKEDLETLSEIFNGVGFSTSLTDGSAHSYSFNDKEIEQSYKEIDKHVKIIQKNIENCKTCNKEEYDQV